MSKKVGDELMSGSVNGDSSVKMVVEKRAEEDSQYQLIIKLVEESKEKPARFVRLADRYAVPFTLIAYLIGGIAWWASGDPVPLCASLSCSIAMSIDFGCTCCSSGGNESFK